MFGAPRAGWMGVVVMASVAALLVGACAGRTELDPADLSGRPDAGTTTSARDGGGRDAALGRPPSERDAAASTCPSGSALCGGICTDVAYDPNNCGGCGMVCSVGELCSAGACGTACLGGSVQCNGRCADPENDPANCGTCGHACDAGSICSRGACTLGCSGGTTECEGHCANLQNDTTDCGACGAACNVGEYCSAGQCTPLCPSPLQVCEGVCTDTANNSSDCGSCGVVCDAGLVCSNGTCSLECGGGTTKCGDACVVTDSDPANCGSCGNACASTQHCSNGACVDCAEGQTSCNGVCVNLESDTANCGSCGKACPYAYYGTAACKNGTCGGNCYGSYSTCPSATYACSTNLMTDTSNCGSCGNVCPSGEICSSGTCTACAAGKTVCSTACVDLTSDANNCGACAAPCPYRSGATPSCVSSTCKTACYQGYADCDGNATNGCEVVVASDRKNCGSCGNTCGANAVCTQGTCTACVPGSAVCGNGCTNLQTDSSNCGACGVTCSGSAHATSTCKSAACALACTAGYLDCDGNVLDGCETAADKTHCGACNTTCSTGQFCAVTKCAKCSPTDLGQVLPVAINGTTAGASDSFVTTCGQSGQGDTYYSFTAPASRTYTFTLGATYYGEVLEIQNGTCGGAVLACAYGTSPQTLAMTANQTVVVIVESYYNGGGSFTLTVQ